MLTETITIENLLKGLNWLNLLSKEALKRIEIDLNRCKFNKKVTVFAVEQTIYLSLIAMSQADTRCKQNNYYFNAYHTLVRFSTADNDESCGLNWLVALRTTANN
jgi:hypothetical protein